MDRVDWKQVLCTCNVNHGITIISTKEAIKGFTNGFVSHSMVNVYIFCAIKRIGFPGVKKDILHNRPTKTNQEGKSASKNQCSVDKNTSTFETIMAF